VAIIKKFDAPSVVQPKVFQKKTDSKPSFLGAVSGGALSKSSGTPASSRKPDMSIMPIGKELGKVSKKPDMSIMPVSPKTKKKVGY
jgi:hypothetical protein